MQELKTIKRRVWYAWEVRGSLNVVEMGKGLWLFEFDNKKEAERILRGGIRNLGGFSMSQEIGQRRRMQNKEMAWVRLIGLLAHLWSRPILRRIGDRCGGFLAMYEDTTFLSDLRWARIRVKWNGITPPPYIEMSEGQSRYEIQLWWEIQPFVRFANALTEMAAGNERREDKEEGTRAGESVGVLGRRREKIYGIEDVSSGREKKIGCLAQKQANEVDPGPIKFEGRAKNRALSIAKQGRAKPMD